MQGIIEEEKLHSFHIPQYMPSAAEVKEGSFAINRLETSEIKWSNLGSISCQPSSVSANDNGYNMAKCIRSVAESLLVEHFGAMVIDDLFDKYRTILSCCMSKEEQKSFNVTISMTRMGWPQSNVSLYCIWYDIMMYKPYHLNDIGASYRTFSYMSPNQINVPICENKSNWNQEILSFVAISAFSNKTFKM